MNYGKTAASCSVRICPARPKASNSLTADFASRQIAAKIAGFSHCVFLSDFFLFYVFFYDLTLSFRHQ